MAAMGLNDLSHLRRALMILSRSASHEFLNIQDWNLFSMFSSVEVQNKWLGIITSTLIHITSTLILASSWHSTLRRGKLTETTLPSTSKWVRWVPKVKDSPYEKVWVTCNSPKCPNRAGESLEVVYSHYDLCCSIWFNVWLGLLIQFPLYSSLFNVNGTLRSLCKSVA